MARKATLYVPTELEEALDSVPAEVNLSALFQEMLRELVASDGECSHTRARCRRCGKTIDVAGLHAA